MPDWDETYRAEAAKRRSDAARLLGDGDFITVELPPDPDWPSDAGDVLVEFGDLVAPEKVGWKYSRSGAYR